MVIRAGNFYSQLKCHLNRGKKKWQSRLPDDGRGSCKMRRMNEKIIVKANKSGQTEGVGGGGGECESQFNFITRAQDVCSALPVVALTFHNCYCSSAKAA